MRRSFVLLAAGVIIGLGLHQLNAAFRTQLPNSQEIRVLPSLSNNPTKTPDKSSLVTFSVRRVIDGDTIELTDRRRVRYIGVDTPESSDPRILVECFARQAADENRILVEGKNVRLEKDISETDSYGRLLRYVYVEDTMVNEHLVRRGFASVSTFPPDVKYLDRFLAAQRLAQEEGAGLWSRCAGPTPFQSRADGPVDSTGTFLGKNLPSAGMRFVR